MKPVPRAAMRPTDAILRDFVAAVNTTAAHRGWTQGEVADALGIARETWSRTVAGKATCARLRLLDVVELAVILEVEPAMLFAAPVALAANVDAL